MQIPKTIRHQVKKTKVCAFEGCSVDITTTAKGKYCEEHKKQKYFKEKYLDKYKAELKLNDTNQIIKHNFSFAVKRLQKCECCGNNFTILLLPRVYVYPKYCNEHINEHKRNMHIKNKLRNHFEIT